jgi:hypothetical protein
MVNSLFGCDPLLRVGLQHLLQKIHHQLIGLLVLRRIEVEAAGPVFIEDLVVGLALE